MTTAHPRPFSILAWTLATLCAASCSCGDDETTVAGAGAGGAGGAGGGDPCANVSCTEAPPPVCVGEATLRSYSGVGSCVDGACVFDQYSDAPCTDCCYGAEINLTGNPLGGGVGYSAMVDPAQASVVVATAADLLGALSSASSGTVIYVDDAADIDLSDVTEPNGIVVPGGVTLASGRGRNGSAGGLIHCDSFAFPLFWVDGDAVRFTGLRLRGPNPEVGDHDYDLVTHSSGIATGSSGLEVDNCELWAWGTEAISLGSGALDGHVHHNFIHHTRRAGYGYGVVLDQSSALIEGNVFDTCRHDIAGTGRAGTSYEARYNLVLEHANGHDFDMHGAADFEKNDTKAIWRFDEGQGTLAADSSTSGYHPQNDCTLVNMDPAACWVAGRINTALDFDGADDHLECGSDASLGSAQGSVSFWLQAASLTQAADVIYFFADASNYLAVGLDATGHVQVRAVQGGVAQLDLTADAALPDTSFHHVAVTQDGTSPTLYLDGQPTAASGTSSGAWSDGLALAGAWVGGGPHGYLAGVLDEVRIYSSALTAETVARQYAGAADIAGENILIHHNTFRGLDQSSIIIRGVPSTGASIHHNWFHLDDPTVAVRQTNAQGNLAITDNHFGRSTPLGTVLPIARAQIDPSFGKAPLATALDSSQSSDPVGMVVGTTWDPGDGSEVAAGRTAAHEYMAPGRYLVRATVREELGALASTFVPVAVAPTEPSYLLDFWVKDSYSGPLEQFYLKQAFVDGQLVWQDDVAGDEGWMHVSQDVTDIVSGTDRADVTLRVQNVNAVANQELIELDVLWDDVALFGGSVVGGDFEGSVAWSFAESGASWSGRPSSMEPHSGDWAYWIGYPYATACPAGAYAEITQSVLLVRPELRGSWLLDDGHGTTAQDGSLYGNHATLANMDPAQAWVAGIMSRALAFDGIDDHLDAGAATSLATAQGSLVLWLRADALGQEQTLFELFDAGLGNTSSVSLTAEGRARLTVVAGGAPVVDLTSQTAISSGGFHHLAVTQDGTQVRIYLDGQDAGASGQQGTAWTDHVVPAGAWLGAGHASAFTGVLDEVQIFSTALDAASVAEAHRRGVVLGQWRFDDGAGSSAQDSSGSGHDGTLTNMDTASCWTTGHTGGALAFDGIDDTVDCASPATLGSSQGTVELWLKPATLSDDRDLVNIFQDGWSNFLLVRRTADNRILALIEENDVAVMEVTSSVTLDDQWHYVAVTQGGSGVLIYVDGVEAGTAGTNSPAWTGDLALTGMWLGGGHWSYYQGLLDEVRLYARALRPDEIAAHAAGP